MADHGLVILNNPEGGSDEPSLSLHHLHVQFLNIWCGKQLVRMHERLLATYRKVCVGTDIPALLFSFFRSCSVELPFPRWSLFAAPSNFTPNLSFTLFRFPSSVSLLSFLFQCSPCIPHFPALLSYRCC
mmetsp:Transcript_27828/g.78696  ORF Transcript_27828/g.78696 Transcript_27828/m.78696 type:complete len:129 (-) Transcript_27828:3023-3409(-)